MIAQIILENKFYSQKFLLNEEFQCASSQLINTDDKATEVDKTDETKALLNGNSALHKSMTSVDPEKTNYGLILKSVQAKWNPESTQLTLEKINFSVSKGQLLAIIGPVGAGKVRLSIYQVLQFKKPYGNVTLLL